MRMRFRSCLYVRGRGNWVHTAVYNEMLTLLPVYQSKSKAISSFIFKEREEKAYFSSDLTNKGKTSKATHRPCNSRLMKNYSRGDKWSNKSLWTLEWTQAREGEREREKNQCQHWQTEIKRKHKFTGRNRKEKRGEKRKRIHNAKYN